MRIDFRITFIDGHQITSKGWVDRPMNRFIHDIQSAFVGVQDIEIVRTW